MNWIGVDIGGSHISAAQVRWDGIEAQFGSIYEADVNTFRSADEIVSDWAAVLRKAIGNQPDLLIGVAMPGPFDYPNGISLIKDQGKMKALYGISVRNLLAGKLEIDPDKIFFTNDAEAFLSGECLAGAGRNFENALGLTLGTGLGSAMKIGTEVKDAKLWTASFRGGIAEDYLGTNWFKKYASENHGRAISGVKDLQGSDFNPEVAEEIYAQFGSTLGEFLSNYVFDFPCQGVVLGGKIARVAGRFLPYTHAYLEKHPSSIEISISELEERAALIGACFPFISKV
jgi:glucokinase